MSIFLQFHTNHCVRATDIKTLKGVGFANEEICAQTGLKDERSVARYDKRQADPALDKMSKILTRKMKHTGTDNEESEAEIIREITSFSNSSVPVTNFMQKNRTVSHCFITVHSTAVHFHKY